VTEPPVTLTAAEERRVLLEARAAKATTRLEELRQKAERLLARAGESEGITVRPVPDFEPLVIQARLDLSRLDPKAFALLAEPFGALVEEAQQVQVQLREMERDLQEARAAVRLTVDVRFPEPI